VLGLGLVFVLGSVLGLDLESGVDCLILGVPLLHVCA